MAITIKKAGKNEASILAKLGKITFYETYSIYNTKEDMESYVHLHYQVSVLEEELSNPNNFFFIAYVDEIPAGFIKLRTNKQPEALIGRKHIELEKIYVLQQFQQQKIGPQLMNTCKQTAVENGYEVLWLGVWEHNAKALQFYIRQGFEKFGEHIFLLGTDEQTDYLMKLELKVLCY